MHRPTRALAPRLTAAQELFTSDPLQELLVWMLRDEIEHSVIQEVVEKPWHFLDLLNAHQAEPTKRAGEVLDDLEYAS